MTDSATRLPMPDAIAKLRELPDAQLITRVATKVLGWKVLPPRSKGPGVDGMIEFRRPNACNACWWSGSCEWDPLTSDSDCFMVVDAMRVKGWWFMLTVATLRDRNEIGWIAQFWNGSGEQRITDDPDRRRAMLLAALSVAGEGE